jgi:hypothetical protein
LNQKSSLNHTAERHNESKWKKQALKNKQREERKKRVEGNRRRGKKARWNEGAERREEQ